MKGDLTFLLNIALILLFANVGGYISRRLKQPAVLGQIVVGLILGPSILNLIEGTEALHHMAEIGVILLMFIAGLETEVDELKASSKSSALIAVGGVVVPMGLGILAVMVGKPDASLYEGVFLGVILTATSVSITVQALRELGQLKTRQGVGILGAAIIDDVVGIIILTLVIGIISPTQGASILIVLGKIVVFFVFSIGFGVIFSRVLTKYSDVVDRGNRVLTAALIFCFLLAFVAEELGVAAIIGAYFTGVVFSTTPHRNRVSHEIQSIAYALFTPIFFINIGLSVKIEGVGGIVWLSTAIIVAALVGKVIGCGVGAKLSKFTNRQAMQISLGMMPRAEVALIVTNLGLKMGIIGKEIFTSVILMVLVSTIVTPPLLKIAFDDKGNKTKKERVREAV